MFQASFPRNSRPPWWAAILAPLLSALLLTGCGVTSLTSHSTKSPESPPGGIMYHLPMDMLTVNATRQDIVKVSIEPDYSVKRDDPVRKYTVAVSKSTEVDLSRTYVLEVDPGQMNADDVTIDVSPTGLLTGVTFNSSGKGAEVVTNVSKTLGTFVGTAMAYFVGMPAAGGGAKPPKTDDKYREQVVLAQYSSNTTCGIDELVREGLDRPSVKAIIYHQPVCDLWIKYKDARDKLAEAENLLDVFPMSLELTTYAQAVAHKKEQRTREQDVALYKAAFDKAESAFNAAKTNFIKDFGLTTQADTKTHDAILAFSDLPTQEQYVKGEFSEPIRMLQREIGLILTYEAFTNAPHVSFELSGKQQPKGIYYRKRLPYILRAYGEKLVIEKGAAQDQPPGNNTTAADGQNATAADGQDTAGNTGGQDQGKPTEQGAGNAGEQKAENPKPEYEFVNLIRAELIDSRSYPGFIPYEASRFADRNLGLTFYEDGTLKQFKLVTTSSAAGFTGGVEAGTQGFLNNTNTALGTMADIFAKRDKIRLDALQAEAARLQAQKSIIDAEIDLEGTTANRELRVRKMAIETQLALIQAAQQYASGEQGAAAEPELAALKNEVELLRQRLELLKIQQEMNTLQQ